MQINSQIRGSFPAATENHVTAIHSLQTADGATRDLLTRVYAKPREGKTVEEIAGVLEAMRRQGSVEFAKDVALRLTLECAEIVPAPVRLASSLAAPCLSRRDVPVHVSTGSVRSDGRLGHAGSS